MNADLKQRLLQPADPSPVDVVNADSDLPVLLVCEHAGRAVPSVLSGGDFPQEALDSHRGWDIGAEAVARKIAQDLSAPLVVQRYSRLVIDCNRPIGTPQSIPEVSDRMEIPGNIGLSPEERHAREEEIFQPLDRAIESAFCRHERLAVFSIHSFTPVFGGQARPWHAGFLSRKTLATAESLMASVAQAQPELHLALNEPYRIEDNTDWLIPAHAEARGLPHCLIEIRNDEIDTPEGAALWSGLLAGAIRTFLGTLT